MNNFNEILVVAGVFFNKGKVLAALRPISKSSGGLWEFPGGKVEKGELPEEALARELLEELSVSIRILGRIAQSEMKIEQRYIRMILFEVSLTEGIFVPNEHSELRWLSEEELGQLDWAPLDIPLIENVRTLLMNKSAKKTLI